MTSEHMMMEATSNRARNPAGTEAIHLRNLSVSFTSAEGTVNRVIEGLDLRVPHGEFVALVGRSGCGKTTILNVIAGLVQPLGGEAVVLGRSPRAARDELGFMPARDALLPWRSAKRNVEYGLEIRGVEKRKRAEIARKWLRAVHLEEAEDHWPWQLSQGMRQRVALARTWALDPALFLMDEPFAALDAHTRVSVQNEFLSLWEAGPHKTVLFVTHDLGEAVALADRVIVLAEGRLVGDEPVHIERPRDMNSVLASEKHRQLVEQLSALLS